MRNHFSIIVSTRDRCDVLKHLLESFKALRGLDKIQPEIIIGDNNSQDQTWDKLQHAAKEFLPPLRLLKVVRAGKCSVLNEAIRVATGDVLAFLDDDVSVDPGWLEAVDLFFRERSYTVGQGVVRIPPCEAGDQEIQRLLERYRTIPSLQFKSSVQDVHSLNGSNFAISRKVFEQVGTFDERLGPGASGTSEDVELAQRIRRAGIKIGYIPDAIVYHRLDRSRLTEDYFRLVHERQGNSRLLFKNPGTGRIVFDLSRVIFQYGFYSLSGSERNKYRNKGRIYHYLGMLKSKWKRAKI